MTPEDLSLAIENRNWYAIVAIALWAIIAIWKNRAPELYSKIPDGWRWVPPVAVAIFAGFVDGYTSGLTSKQSMVRAVWALLTIGIGSMGVHGILKEAPGSYGGGKGGGKVGGEEEEKEVEKLQEDPIPESET